jgi:hypothetical protein
VTVYRTGNHWGVTIVREGAGHHVDDCGCTTSYTDPWCKKGTEAQLVAVVVNGDQALAERICALLNADERRSVMISNLRPLLAAELDDPEPLPPEVVAAAMAAARRRAGEHGHEHSPGTPPHDHGPCLAIHRGVRGEHTEGHR